MKSQKAYILKIILVSFIFFVFSNVASAITGSIDTSENPTVNIGANNRVKVCRDVACNNPEIINFEISGDFPLIIDTEKGLSGKVWGGDLGWVTFNPPYGGVFFADPATGLLKGTAWSEISGAINFSVTGQKVVIDPKTGEWNGWAWASGPYGGWIKFDCKDATSCVHTIWNGQTKANTSPTPDIGKNEGQSFIKTFSSSFTNLFDGTGQLIIDAFDSLFSSLTNTGSAILTEIAKINGSAFTTSAYNLKNLFNQMIVIKYEMVNVIGQKFNNAYNSVATFLANVFTQNSLVNKNEPPLSPTLEGKENKNESSTLVKTKFSEVYDSIAFNLDKIQTSKISPTTEIEEVPVLRDIAEVQLSPTSPTLGIGENIKNVFKEKSKIMSDNFDIFVAESISLFNEMTALKSNIFARAGDSYYSFSSNLINLKGSVLEGLNNLFRY